MSKQQSYGVACDLNNYSQTSGLPKGKLGVGIRDIWVILFDILLHISLCVVWILGVPSAKNEILGKHIE